MPLDYANLPLLLTLDEVAELFRCSASTVRTRRKEDPDWLRPVSHGLMRKQLFARADLLKLLGQPASVQAVASEEHPDPWDPTAATGALEQAKRERIWEQTEKRSQRYNDERDAWTARIAIHHPSARANRVWGCDSKARLEVAPDGESFRFWLHFQPRFRPPGWPGEINIPRTGPAWVRLETEAEMGQLRSEIHDVMAEYQPQWDALVAERKRVRAAAKARR